MSNHINDTTSFIGIRDFDQDDTEDDREDDLYFEDTDLLASEPVEIIVARVVFALLVSVSLVMNLLLALGTVYVLILLTPQVFFNRDFQQCYCSSYLNNVKL